MGAVQFETVEPEPPGVCGRLSVGLDDVGDLRLAGRLGDPLARLGETGGSEGDGIGVRFGSTLVEGPHMPQLRHDRPARVVYRFEDPCPAGERRVAKEMGDRGIHRGRRVRNHRPLGDNQTDTLIGSATVIRRDVGAGHAPGRECPGHGSHHDTVG